MLIRKIGSDDIDAVVRRIVDRLVEESQRCPYVSCDIGVDELARALRDASLATWVAERQGEIVGHLYGALLESESYERGAWVGPDGVSFDETDVLSELYAVAGREWIESNAREHYAWVLDDVTSTTPWYELGFSRMHSRGVLGLETLRLRPMPDGFHLRRGSVDDLDSAVALTQEIDVAQGAGPSFATLDTKVSQRDEVYEMLIDPDVAYYVVEHDGVPVAQCMTFPLPPRRGSFDATWHLSAVAVQEDHRLRGVATAMIDAALTDARREGGAFVETNWRVTNRRAARFWQSYGFHPTYVRLHRTIGRH